MESSTHFFFSKLKVGKDKGGTISL